jgi:hypothetical protein
MRAHYVVYPRSSYLIESFRGPVTLPHLEAFLARQAADARIEPHYHTVSDYTQASIHLSNDEVQRFATLLCSAPFHRTGKRAFVLSDARLLAYANSCTACLSHTDLIVRCFQHRSAALQWVGQESTLGQTCSNWLSTSLSPVRTSLKSSASA